MFTLKQVALISIAGMILFGLAVFPAQSGLCSTVSDYCRNFLAPLSVALFISFPLAFFSLITFFVNQKTFEIWAKFSTIYIPIYILLTLMMFSSANQGGGIGISGATAGAFNALLVLFALAFYVLISMGIIIVKSVLLWWNKK